MTSAAANATGIVGTIFWCIQLVPQVIRNYRVKDCTGVPLPMMLLWFTLLVPFAIYFNVVDTTMPVRIQPELFMFFCGITFFQILYYPPIKIGFVRAAAVTGAITLVGAGVIAGCIVDMRPRYHDAGSDNTWGPVLAVGVVATVMFILGLVPPYFELWKRGGEVVGINFIFLAMDSMGALFSVISVALASTEPGFSVDIMGVTMYASVLVMEGGIFLSHLIWWLRIGRKQVKEKGESEGEETSGGESAKEEVTEEVTEEATARAKATDSPV